MQAKERMEFLDSSKVQLVYTTLLLDLTEKNREILDTISINDLNALDHIRTFFYKEYIDKFNAAFEKYVREKINNWKELEKQLNKK